MFFLKYNDEFLRVLTVVQRLLALTNTKYGLFHLCLTPTHSAQNNLLSELPDALAPYNNLRTARLGYNNFTTIPSGATNIVDMDMSYQW